MCACACAWAWAWAWDQYAACASVSVSVSDPVSVSVSDPVSVSVSDPVSVSVSDPVSVSVSDPVSVSVSDPVSVSVSDPVSVSVSDPVSVSVSDPVSVSVSDPVSVSVSDPVSAHLSPLFTAAEQLPSPNQADKLDTRIQFMERAPMLSQTTEYALRAAVCLARDSEVAKTTAEISHATQVPSAYLSKVLQGLSRAGLVKSQRGLHGGFMLAESPSRVTILAIIDAVEPIRRIETCPLDLPGHGTKLCALHSRLDDAIAHVQTAFRTTTLAEVLEERGGAVALCPVPKEKKRT